MLSNFVSVPNKTPFLRKSQDFLKILTFQMFDSEAIESYSLVNCPIVKKSLSKAFYGTTVNSVT